MEIRAKNKQNKNDLQLSFMKIRLIFFRLAKQIKSWIYSLACSVRLKLLTLKMYEVEQIISGGAKTDI
jgi:hypothetical protein